MTKRDAQARDYAMEASLDLARRMPHPWCSDVSRDEAIRRAEDDAANWRRLEVGEFLQDGDEFYCGANRWERVPDCCFGSVVDEDSLTHRRRRVPLPDHRDLPSAVAELRERVARLEAVTNPRPEPTAGSGLVTPLESTPKLAPGANAGGEAE